MMYKIFINIFCERVKCRNNGWDLRRQAIWFAFWNKAGDNEKKPIKHRSDKFDQVDVCESVVGEEAYRFFMKVVGA